MKAVILALVLGGFLNLSTYGGQVYPLGSVAAVVIMGVWLKNTMDRHFEDLRKQMKNGGGGGEDF